MALTANGVKSSSKASQDRSEELLELALKAAGGRELFRQAREIAVTLHGCVHRSAYRLIDFGPPVGTPECRA
jgi:hypothetical protein